MIILLCVFYITGCNRDYQKPGVNKSTANQTLNNNGKTPDDISLKANLKKADIGWVDEHGKPIWKVGFREGNAVQLGNNGIAELVDVNADLYHDGKLAATMNAPKLAADSQNRVVSATGGVKIISAEGNGFITADKVIWKSKENKIYGYGNILMKKDNISASASSVTADTALNKIALTNAEISMK